MKTGSSNKAVYPSLRDKTVFVTGGGTGIGEYIVAAFCGQGAKVAFVDIKAEESRALCERLGKDADNEPLFLECDIRDITALKEAIEETRRRLGNISVLINNAADDRRISLEEVTEQVWDEQVAVNLRPSFFASVAVAEHMKEVGGGAIINFGSICWHVKQQNMHAYAASKAAMTGLSRSLARDLGVYGIRVNTLVPGWVMTKRQLENYIDEDGEKWINETQCIKKRVTADDIASMALFLAADDSAKISAETFVVDGGLV